MTNRVEGLCPLCGSSDAQVMGLRGNREFPGADRAAIPHIVAKVLRCQRCDFFYIDSGLAESISLQKDHYSDPGKYLGMQGRPESIRHRLRIIERHVGSRGRLLDVGAGLGEFVRAASEAGWDSVGIEPSGNLVEYAVRHGASVREGYVRADDAGQFGMYDVVTMIHVLEHLDAAVDVLATLRLYLKPAGLLFVEVPNCDSYFLRLVDTYYRTAGLGWSARLAPFHPPFHRYGYTERSLRYAIGTAGYSVKERGTLTGRDRGCGLSGAAPRGRLLARQWASVALDACGNRELLYAVASRN